MGQRHNEDEVERPGGTFVKVEVVSPPGARVVETVYTLSPKAAKRLQIHAEIPAVNGVKAR